MLRCVFASRPRGVRRILLLAVFNYGIYLFMIQGLFLRYMFMLRIFPGFTGEDSAVYNVVMKMASKT